ncbi:MAG: DNA polymerase III subunit alpha [Bacteriovoracaceae bacterium]|nr:DNA polymerase III subunit alpha [Bacteriovoracaceae bacterium]
MPDPCSLDHKDSSSFVHLHLHTQYSLLDGAIRLQDLFSKAKEYNMPAVAMTDHGNMFGAIDFYTRAKDAGIKPIIGCEVYMTTGSRLDRKIVVRKNAVAAGQDEVESGHQIHHLVLLCKNNIGYQNLCKLVSIGYLEGFYYKPRIDYEVLSRYSEGLIATTACLKGDVGYHFFTGEDKLAHEAISKLHGIFKDDLYLEIQENGLPEQAKINKKIISYASSSGLPLVATNDCHYLNRDDATAQEVLLCIQTGKTLQDEKRMKLSSDEFYFKSPDIMRDAFSEHISACDNTLKIASQCNVELNWKDKAGNQIYHIPDFEINTSETTDEYFARVSKEGLLKRFQGPHFAKIKQEQNWESLIKPMYHKRLEEEIAMIIEMGFAGYFLIVSDFIKWSKENDIPVGPGRGSGAGSLVAYSLLITNINPIPFNLLFERFINPERVTMPDFDIDFCQTRRSEVIEYVTQKYGAERVGQIITFGKMLAKGVIRDVSRVFDLPYSEADMIAKLIPDELKMTLDKALELEPKLGELIESDPKIKQIMKVSKRLEGLLRHASIHAAGVIITNEPLVKHAPLFKGKEGEQVCQFDKDFSEMTGLIKFDFLGLKTLTVIANAVSFIRRDHDASFDIEEIDLEDPHIYQFISKGQTIGVFQLESSGMIDLCKRIMPSTLEDITAINALYRPGPLESGMVDDFIEVKHGRSELVFPFPQLESTLKDTYGVIVYQEQVMNIARIVAGYSLGQADMLRRAMGKKKDAEMQRHREIFLEGAKKNNFDEEKAANLYDLMANFAAYGFNKSHAVAYALIAYQTAFLKAYYPAPFFAALLSTELSNTDKVTAYINDAKLFDIEVLPPDINESLWPFNVVGKNIRFGMGAIKNVGEGAVSEIIKQRQENGPYTGFINFCERISFRAVNKRVLESLIKVGAFDSCETYNRKTLLENMELITTYAAKKQEQESLGQVSLFDLIDANQKDSNSNPQDWLDIIKVEDMAQREKLSLEAELMGIYISGHPLDVFNNVITQVSSMTIAEIPDVLGDDRRDVILAGMIVSRKNIISRKGHKMCFATLEDLSGKIECIIFPKVFEEYEQMIAANEPLIMHGHINLAESPRKFFPSKIGKLQEQTEDRITGVRINLSLKELSSSRLKSFKQLLLMYRGSVPLHIIFNDDGGRARLPLGDEFLVNPTPQMAAKVNDIWGANAVKYVIDGKVEEAL